MTQILTTVLIIIAFVMTLGVCITNPKMHSRVIVFDSSYTIVEEKPNTDEIKEIVEEIPQKAIEEPKAEVVKTEVREIKKQEPKEIKTIQVKKESKPITQTTVRVETPKTTKTVEVKKETKPIVQTVVQKEAPKPSVQTLTEQQEIIAWNKWHSDIQNQLMKDVKLPSLPNGIIFVFTFTVDKYGKITNIQTYSTDSKYTPYAIEYIAPVIRSYQGKAIVEFPKGSKREITNFKGRWKMSTQAKYSRPEDYNDSEVIKK